MTSSQPAPLPIPPIKSGAGSPRPAAEGRGGAICARHLAASADCLDRLTAAIGRAAIWLSLFIVLVQFAVALMRYAFAFGSIQLSESVIYGHAALFMLAAAWTLQEDGHVRVDVFYGGASARSRAMVDLLGSLLLLLPFVAVVAWFALPYVARSWTILERSREISGLPFVYLLKTLIPLFALLLGLQGISQVFRAALVLMNKATVRATAETR